MTSRQPPPTKILIQAIITILVTILATTDSAFTADHPTTGDIVAFGFSAGKPDYYRLGACNMVPPIISQTLYDFPSYYCRQDHPMFQHYVYGQSVAVYYVDSFVPNPNDPDYGTCKIRSTSFYATLASGPATWPPDVDNTKNVGAPDPTDCPN